MCMLNDLKEKILSQMDTYISAWSHFNTDIQESRALAMEMAKRIVEKSFNEVTGE